MATSKCLNIQAIILNLSQTLEESSFEPALLEAINRDGIRKRYKADAVILEAGTLVNSLPLVLEGAIRVMRRDEEDGELLLYYLEAGETCAATISCCMGNQRSNIHAIAETDCEVLFIPIQRMDEWVAKYPSWRNFIFRSFSERFDELLGAVDSVAFGGLEERLSNLLRDKALFHNTNSLSITHQQLAEELHSSRVVISRLLKSFEQLGKIRIHRNRIELLNKS